VEPTTYSENTLRSPIHPGMAKAARDHCPAGHLFDEKNTRWWKGARFCRACQAARARATRGSAPRNRATETHCVNGHPWEGNLRATWEPGKPKVCTSCQRDASKRFRERNPGRLPA
jgi:hypothetical protein